MSKLYVFYGTKEGHTSSIVDRLASSIQMHGQEVVVERLGKKPVEIPEDAGAVILGGSIHVGRNQPEVREFAKRNRSRLEEIPSAFFQVCLTAADKRPEAQVQIHACLEAFVEETGWRPSMSRTFAGMLAWTKYGFFKRTAMKRVLRSAPLSEQELDTSHDVDYTDYEAVDRFGEDFLRSLDQQPLVV